MKGVTKMRRERVQLMPTPVYKPRHAPNFRPTRIILAKGSLASPDRRATVEAICSLYPNVEIEEQLSVPHNRIKLGDADPLSYHYMGKRTLVFGEHQSALKRSTETGNTCPNYWHFSPYGFCPFDCKYCYLAGTPGIRFSPTVKIFVNVKDILLQIDKRARQMGKPTAFYVGKLQDGLALDPLSGYSRVIIPFFARHPFARLTLLTKATCVENLLGLDHNGHTFLSWSLNPEGICGQFEANTPPVEERLKAMQRCVAAGYPIQQRIEIYRHIIDRIRELGSDLAPALCLEERVVFEALGITSNIGQCNCVF